MIFKHQKKIYKLSILILLLLVFTGIFFGLYINHVKYIKDSPYDVIVSDIEANSVVLSWKTVNDMPTFVKLKSSEILLGSEKLTKFHRVKVIDLKENSTYTFKISDIKREWESDVIGISQSLEPHSKSTYSFKTTPLKDEIPLPIVEELHVLPNELIYVSLYDTKSERYSEVRSFDANKYGGVAVDIKAFEGDWDIENTSVKNINYFTSENTFVKSNTVYASEVNCNQNISNQTINGISREEFADLAKRWTAGRGRTYAYECFNDVVYRAKMAGVDPAFTLAVWLNESGASNYTQDPQQFGYIEDWGIHGRADVPPQNFNAQIQHFLKRGHYNTCPGLSQWEAWGNIYRYGTCNTGNTVAQQQGIDYYQRINNLYRWITNGKNLPKKVTSITIPINENPNWETNSKSKCCAIKIKNDDLFIGNFEKDTNGKSCNDIWQGNNKQYSEIVEYATEIPNLDANICEVKFKGVCCHLPNDIIWYPKDACPNIVENISSSRECKQYASEMSCFFRDGKYKWLPKVVGDDTVDGVINQIQCESRNIVNTFTVNLNKGINFVGFDFSPVLNISPLYASELLFKYPQIQLIGNFQGYGWKDLIKQSESIPFVGQDFFFEQNRGYLIITEEDISLTLDGWRNPNAQYTQLEEGWNLVGGSIYSKPSTASSLISNLKEENIDVDIVGIWEYDLGSFIFRREEESGQVYGVDIQIDQSDAIFLKK